MNEDFTKFYINGIPVYRKIKTDGDKVYYLYEISNTTTVLYTSGLSSELADWQLVVDLIKENAKRTIKNISRVDQQLEIIIG